MNRLNQKKIIVTGGSVGIGRACVLRMVEEGAAVAIFDTDELNGQSLVKEVVQQGGWAGFWKVDVSQEQEVAQAIHEAAQAMGGLNVLVNNAGVSGSPKPTDEVTEAEWDWVQAINVKGVMFCTKHAIGHLRQAGAGSVVNLSSIAGLVGIGGISAYHASKGAVRLMSKNDAITYAAEGIRVNSVHPAYIWTPMVEKHLSKTAPDLEAAKQAAGQAHPVGHMGEPDDVAWAVVWLASDEAKFVTGTEIAVDGGYTAR